MVCIQMVWIDIKWIPKRTTKYQNNFSDFLLLLITFRFSASCLVEVHLGCASDHILFSF